jgi:beta-galactosidase/beta-glucuronidase
VHGLKGEYFRVTATARDAKGKKVGAVIGPANTTLSLPIKKPHLWSPDDSYLYDLEITLTQGSSTDTVASYCGPRRVQGGLG